MVRVCEMLTVSSFDTNKKEKEREIIIRRKRNRAQGTRDHFKMGSGIQQVGLSGGGGEGE